ncbi:MAG: hypothetical protein V1817_04195 [Candidatus Micrarchaeota archaeon]
MPSLPENAARSLAFAGLGRFLSQSSLAKLGKNLERAGARRLSAREWASASLFVALLAAALAAFASLAASGEIFAALALGFLIFALAFGAAFNYPRVAAAKRAEEIERDLAVALRAVSLELAAGASFESVLRRETRADARAARGDSANDVSALGGSELSKEFSRVLREAERTGLGAALSAAGERSASPLVKRAFAQLRFACEHGGKGEAAAAPLRKLADELVSVQKTRAREFAAKQTFFGLLFVSVACVAPALFAAYVIVGSAFLELSFGVAEVLFAFIVLFPLVDAAILAYLRWKTPKLLSS